MPGGGRAEYLLQVAGWPPGSPLSCRPTHVQICTYGGQSKRKAWLSIHMQLLGSRHAVWRQSRTHNVSVISSSETTPMQVLVRMLRAGRETSQMPLTSMFSMLPNKIFSSVSSSECLLPGWLVQQENKPYQV